MKSIALPDHAAIAEMAAAIEDHVGPGARKLVQRQLSEAEGDMITTWAAILTHLRQESPTTEPFSNQRMPPESQPLDR